jgi:hypothetical protein
MCDFHFQTLKERKREWEHFDVSFGSEEIILKHFLNMTKEEIDQPKFGSGNWKELQTIFWSKGQIENKNKGKRNR